MSDADEERAPLARTNEDKGGHEDYEDFYHDSGRSHNRDRRRREEEEEEEEEEEGEGDEGDEDEEEDEEDEDEGVSRGTKRQKVSSPTLHE